LQNEKGASKAENPVKEMLPVPKKVYPWTETMDLPQDVRLWSSVILDAFVTECIDRELNCFRNRDPGKYLPTRHCPESSRYLSDSSFGRKITNGQKTTNSQTWRRSRNGLGCIGYAGVGELAMVEGWHKIFLD
jgi:hypothetical protein